MKKKVLIANNHLKTVGGSELYTYDLIKALNSQNDIDVEYFTFEKGLISDQIEEELNIGFMSHKNYDLILASHNSTVKELFSKAPIIQICHGVVPALEQPSPLANYHVAISEEISNHLINLDYDNKVILNGVDIKEKKPQTSPNEKLSKVLSLCQDDSANKRLEKICEKRNIEFKSFNKNINPNLKISGAINRADLVVGIGRSIYDAMACGRPCLIYDNRHYNGSRADGYLRPKKFYDYVKKNCSGRFLNRRYNDEQINRELDKYNWEDGDSLREIAVKELNAYRTAQELLNVLHSLSLKDKIKIWKRYAQNLKLIKRVYLYRKIYNATGLAYFNKF